MGMTTTVNQKIMLVASLSLTIYCVMILLNRLRDGRVLVRGSDQRLYKVRNTRMKQETADLLARLNAKVISFLERLQKTDNGDFQPAIERLVWRYRPDSLGEGKFNKQLTSYTINKGEEVALCVRSRDAKEQAYDENLLLLVFVHELAHIASVYEDHGPEFQKNFAYLRRKAIEWGLAREIRDRFHYCGLDVNGL